MRMNRWRTAFWTMWSLAMTRSYSQYHWGRILANQRAQGKLLQSTKVRIHRRSYLTQAETSFRLRKISQSSTSLATLERIKTCFSRWVKITSCCKNQARLVSRARTSLCLSLTMTLINDKMHLHPESKGSLQASSVWLIKLSKLMRLLLSILVSLTSLEW